MAGGLMMGSMPTRTAWKKSDRSRAAQAEARFDLVGADCLTHQNFGKQPFFDTIG